ncbi:MAG: DUF3226 domain-containing protein [Cyanobacteriota bacterium]
MSRTQGICQQDTNKVLLVEGTTDCHVVMALCQACGVPETFGIYQCGSDVKVLKRLNALIIRPQPPQVIGILIDTDDTPIARKWQSLQQKLRHYHYAIPAEPEQNGTILESAQEEPKLGIWFMPNNRDSGMLEDFCANLADARTLDFAQQCVEQASEQQLTRFKPTHRSKAIIHTYLAWQDEPGYPLGRAITRQSLSVNQPLAVSFTNWLTQLFT